MGIIHVGRYLHYPPQLALVSMFYRSAALENTVHGILGHVPLLLYLVILHDNSPYFLQLYHLEKNYSCQKHLPCLACPLLAL